MMRGLWDRLPFAARLLVTASVALFVAGAAMVGISARQEAADARVDLADVLAQELETLPQALAETVVIGDFATLQQTLYRYVARPLIVEVQYRDVSGATLVSSATDRGESAPAWFLDLFDYAAIKGDAPVTVGGRKYGILSLTLSPHEPAARAWRRLRNHLSILLLAVSMDFVGIWLVLHFGLRPLRKLEAAANALAAGNLAVRVEPFGSPDLRQLIEAFNRMAAAIEQAQANLEIQSEQWYVTLSSIGDAVIATDGDGRVTFMNPLAEKLTGWKMAEAIGRPLLEVFRIVNEISRQRVECPAERALREGAVVGLANHTLLIARDGLERPIADSASPIRHPDGRIDGAVLVFRDQTEERRQLEQLSLAASVFEHSLNGVIITDSTQRILDVNPAFTRVTGYEREEVLGRTPRILASGRHDAAFYAAMWQEIASRGHWQGEIWNRHKSGEVFPEDLTIVAVKNDAGATTHYLGIFRDITQLKMHEAQLLHLAHHDPLTGLPNRALLGDRMRVALAQAGRSASMLAVCYLDLDGFKQINDTLGHAAGDRLLVEVAERLTGSLRGGDTVARLGGDEFVLLLANLADEKECETVLTRLLENIARPVSIEGKTVSVSASIGVTLFPNDGADADTLLRHADQSLYEAKEAGRNHYHLFDPQVGAAARARRAWLERLEAALERGEFCLYYQPKVDMRAGTVVGVEALIRWCHPERGVLGPGEFLPQMEGSDLELRIGEWVIEQALAQMDAWRAEGLDISIAVNVAPSLLAQESFVARLKGMLDDHCGTLADRLQLEVLESAALEDFERVTETIAACRKLGVGFALDDFGTGYSSLTYLKRLPVDLVKIDQSFVKDMQENAEDFAIIKSIVSMAEAFHIAVIAEGIETTSQALAMLRLGCHLGQGYGIARPMPAHELPVWIAAFRPDPLWRHA